MESRIDSPVKPANDRKRLGMEKRSSGEQTSAGWEGFIAKLWPALILIALAGLLIYSNIYHNPFVFDDIHIIRDNDVICDLSRYLQPENFFFRRGFTNLTFALNYQWGKLDVTGYHLVNVVIHVINGWIVYFLALLLLRNLASPDKSPNEAEAIQSRSARRGKSKKARGGTSRTRGPSSGYERVFSSPSTARITALAAALVFICHPLQTQAITYTVQRYAALAALFYMTAVLFYLQARLAHRKKTSSTTSTPVFILYLLAGLSAILALLSKENACTLPVVLLLAEYLLFERSWRAWKKKLPYFTGILVFWVLVGLFIFGFFQKAPELGTLLEDVVSLSRETAKVSRWRYLCTQFNVIVIYIRLLFVPSKQAIDYLYHFKQGFFDGPTPVAFLFLLIVLAAGLLNLKKRPVVTLCILWFFITLSIESSIIPIKDALFEHRLYLPLFGFSLIVPYLVFSLFPGKRVRAAAVCAAIIIAFGITAHVRNAVYRDEITLWGDVVSKRPGNDRGHYNLGWALFNNAQTNEAIPHLKKAISINPQYDEAHDNLGVAYQKLGRYDEAITEHQKAIGIAPDSAAAFYNLGTALDAVGREKEAIDTYRKAIKLDHDHAKAYFNCGNSYFSLKHYEDALECFRKAFEIKPDYTMAAYNQANTLFVLGKGDESIPLYHRVVELDPGHGLAHENLAVAYYHTKQYQQAIIYCDQALAMGVKVKPQLLKALEPYRQ